MKIDDIRRSGCATGGEVVVALKETSGVECTPCGSRVTCNPPPTDTDHDYLVFVASREAMSAAVDILGYSATNESGEHYQDEADVGFSSWRTKDNYNFIVTKNVDFARRHRVGTKVLTKLNLMDKKDRIMVFQAILYGLYKEQP